MVVAGAAVVVEVAVVVVVVGGGGGGGGAGGAGCDWRLWRHHERHVGDEGVQVEDAVRQRHGVQHRDEETWQDADAQAGGRVQRGEGHEGGVGGR